MKFKGSLLNKVCKGYSEQCIAMHHDGKNEETLKAMSEGKMTKSCGIRAFSHLFNGTKKISSIITKSWSEDIPLVQ